MAPAESPTSSDVLRLRLTLGSSLKPASSCADESTAFATHSSSAPFCPCPAHCSLRPQARRSATPGTRNPRTCGPQGTGPSTQDAARSALPSHTPPAAQAHGLGRVKERPRRTATSCWSPSYCRRNRPLPSRLCRHFSTSSPPAPSPACRPPHGLQREGRRRGLQQGEEQQQSSSAAGDESI